MGGLFSYFDPTTPYQGFFNFRPKIVTNAARSLQIGRSVKGLAKANSVGNKLQSASNLNYKLKSLRHAGIIGDPEFRMARTPNPRSVVRGQFQQKRENGKSFQEKYKNIKEAMALLTPNTIEKMKSKKNNKPKLPPIVPKGEFAKLFGPLMKEYRIEEVNRDNFFDTFIQAIEGKNYESRNDINEKNIRKFFLNKFKEVLISRSLTYKQKKTLHNINLQIKDLEDFFKNVDNKNIYNESDKEVINLKKLKKNKARIESLLKEVEQYIKNKNINVLSEKLGIKKENITDIKLFIEENIEKWKSAIDEKIKEYTKYEPSTNKNSIPQIKETVNSITKYGTIEYKELSEKIKNIFSGISKSNNQEDLIIFLELKIVIDKFFELIGGTNFEVKKYNLFSSKIDMDLSQKISKSELKNKSNRITKEINKKTIEELKTKANELIQHLSKYLSNNTKNKAASNGATV